VKRHARCPLFEQSDEFWATNINRKLLTVNKIELYTTPFCPFCVMAKKFFDQRSIKYTDHDVSRNNTLRDKVSRANNWRTVPMIIVNGEFIGGYDDLIQADKQGVLAALLK
jgi:glutaredoxin 3